MPKMLEFIGRSYMKLYIYCRQNDLTAEQKDLLKEKFEDVVILEEPEYELHF